MILLIGTLKCTKPLDESLQMRVATVTNNGMCVCCHALAASTAGCLASATAPILQSHFLPIRRARRTPNTALPDTHTHTPVCARLESRVPVVKPMEFRLFWRGSLVELFASLAANGQGVCRCSTLAIRESHESLPTKAANVEFTGYLKRAHTPHTTLQIVPVRLRRGRAHPLRALDARKLVMAAQKSPLSRISLWDNASGTDSWDAP